MVSALDFQFDQTDDAGALKLLNVVDEFTLECPAIVVERRIDADDVVACLDHMAKKEEPRPMYALTTAPSSSPTPWPTGAASMAPARSSSTPAAPAERLGGELQRPAYGTSC